MKSTIHNNRLLGLSLYWRCQILGWSLVSLLYLYLSIEKNIFESRHIFASYILEIVILISITHSYRLIALRLGWNDLSLETLIARAVPTILLLSLVFMVIMHAKLLLLLFVFFKDSMPVDHFLLLRSVFITGLKLISIWVLGYHLYHYYQKEVQTAKLNAQLAIKAKQAQLDNLSAQLNPHFLFNSLNSIKALIIENPKTARRSIDLLSDLMRSSLYKKDDTMVTIEEELTLVSDYISLEQLRFEERLEYKNEIDENLMNFKIPVLSIQLLVENAIKHGIDKQINGGRVILDIKKENGFIVFKVINPGKLSNKNKKGLGIKNLEERLYLTYGHEAKFNITDLPNKTVEATLKIPTSQQ